MRGHIALLLIVALAGRGARGAAGAPLATHRTLSDVLVPGPADSLADDLRRLQGGGEGGEAARTLGLLQFARGEYGGARQSFARAGGRLTEPGRGNARCWEALAWLAQGAPGKAQSTLKPVIGPAGPNRDRALLLMAQALDTGPDPSKALPFYDRLLKADHPDPIALARAARLEARLGRPERAHAINQRLLELYPASLEATSAGGALASAGEHDRVWVNIGSFVSASAARDLAERARKAGFERTGVFSDRSGGSTRYRVRLGPYDSREEASAAGERVEAAVGTDYWLDTGR